MPTLSRRGGAAVTAAAARQRRPTSGANSALAFSVLPPARPGCTKLDPSTHEPGVPMHLSQHSSVSREMVCWSWACGSRMGGCRCVSGMHHECGDACHISRGAQYYTQHRCTLQRSFAPLPAPARRTVGGGQTPSSPETPSREYERCGDARQTRVARMFKDMVGTLGTIARI